ncbi:hypothetical protein V1525DRAFT_436184 [Lipomyces kononenkoae]|uniref:Uncharacterized protein n=1 Tax=Lipomyces kononenkoae TaxID=34357 RepID=A0ACC3SQA8_LIPKO
MLKDGLESHKQIERFMVVEAVGLASSTVKDWNQLRQLRNILARFDEFTRLVSKAKSQLSMSIAAQWDQVMDIYEEYCIENGRGSRDMAALRRMFNQMVNLPKETRRVPQIRRAKELSRAINESLEMAGLSDDDILDMAEERVADAADDDDTDSGNISSHNSSSGRRSSDTPRPSSVASATPGSGREHASQSRTRTKRDVTGSLVSFSHVERREAREQKIDVIMLYQSQIADLRQELRDSREQCGVLRDQVEDLRQSMDDMRHTFARERADLIAEKDRALQWVMMFEMLQKSRRG